MKRFSKMVSRTVEVPLRHAHQRHELRLQIGGEAREGLRCRPTTGRKAAAVARNADAGRRLLDLDAASSARVANALSQEIGAGAVEQHVAAGHGRGHGVGAGLDAVGQHGVLGAVQSGSTPWMLQGRGADAARSWRPS